MAHRTRKKLTKKEIERDPIGEKLEAGVFFLQRYYKETIGAALVLILVVIVFQYIVSQKKSSSNDAMAGFITSSQTYSQAMSAASGNQAEAAFQALDTSYNLAMQTYNNNPQNEWAKKSAILAAKIDIIRGNYEAAISTLSSILATNPDDSIKIPALLHMGIVLENRGSEQDITNAIGSYEEIVTLTEDNSAMQAEALQGLSRLYFQQGRYEESQDALDATLAITQDTTTFEAFQIARLSTTQQN